MKRSILIISSILFVFITVANDNINAKELFEASKLKLSIANVHLILDLETFDKKGNRKSKVLEVSYATFDQLKKVKIEFIAPENIMGTKIITTEYPDKKGLIEIYMPSTGRVQKIRASQSNLKIMGTEIPIAQFSSTINSDFDFTHIGSEVVNGLQCYKIKVQNPNGKGDYGIAFISKDKEQLYRVEKYDSQSKLIILTELLEYTKINNSSNIVYPQRIFVKNFKTGKSSNMNIRNMNFLEKVTIEDFKLSTKTLLTN
ncbi:MAG: outer membrane lipoprotein-sorting protein [Bacteroidales bacterium]|jgi:hypothetical protein|nr:outer membrane lipoprotein-sorting protein [Bacteroidales bacterium]